MRRNAKLLTLVLPVFSHSLYASQLASHHDSLNHKKYFTQSCVIAPVKQSSKAEFDYINLSALDNVPSVPVFDPTDTVSYNVSSMMTIFDALGIPHAFSTYFVKSYTPNVWNAYIVIDGTVINQAQPGELEFGTSGQLINSSGLNQIIWTPANLTPELINFNISCATQYAAPDNPGIGWTDGYSHSPSFHLALTSYKSDLLNACSSFADLPVPTSIVKLNVNLNASDTIPQSSTISPTDPNSYNFKDQITIYDSLGATYNVTMYFAKTSTYGIWNVGIYLYQTFLGLGQIQFDTNGVITNTSGLDNIQFNPYSGASSPQIFKIDMTCSTQYGFADKNIETPWQDGAPGINISEWKSH